MNLRMIWLRTKEWLLPARHLVVSEGDSLPSHLPWRDLVLLREGDEDWCVGMRCPCGCGQRVELPLLPEVKPKWTLRTDANGCPTLAPSVWLREGCRSHYFVKAGKVVWV